MGKGQQSSGFDDCACLARECSLRDGGSTTDGLYGVASVPPDDVVPARRRSGALKDTEQPSESTGGVGATESSGGSSCMGPLVEEVQRAKFGHTGPYDIVEGAHQDGSEDCGAECRYGFPDELN